MRNHSIKLFGVIAFTLLVNLGRTHAAVIVSNLNAPVGGSGGIYTGARPQAYGQEFTTGSQSATLGSIIVPLGLAQPTFSPAAELVADNGGLPGSTALTTFNVHSIPATSPIDLIFAPTSSILLSANTNYWFILSASGTGTFRWDYTDAVSTLLPNYAASHNLGATWSIEDGGPFLIEVDSASTAPEPSSLFLVGFMGLLGCAVVLIRQAKTELFPIR